jgi:prophage regulatory protein
MADRGARAAAEGGDHRHPRQRRPGSRGLAGRFLFLITASPPTAEHRQMSTQLIHHEDLKLKGIPYSKPHLWRLEKQGKFPRRVPLGLGRYAYVEAEIDNWIAERIAERDPA